MQGQCISSGQGSIVEISGPDMLQKCANPGCTVPFRSLRDGKLFVSETLVNELQDSFDGNRRKTRRREHFWLCAACSMHFTLYFHSTMGMLTVPLSEREALRSAGARPVAKFANTA